MPKLVNFIKLHVNRGYIIFYYFVFFFFTFCYFLSFCYFFLNGTAGISVVVESTRVDCLTSRDIVVAAWAHLKRTHDTSM